jgi:putative glutamine amidotransferase
MIGGGQHDVNSRHHQAALRVGKGLAVSALSMDDVIEGLERPDRAFVVGVQWHPEDRIRVSEMDRKIFEAFRDAVHEARS